MGMEQMENLAVVEMIGKMDLLQEQRGGETWPGGQGNVAWITNGNGLEGKVDPGGGNTQPRAESFGWSWRERHWRGKMWNGSSSGMGNGDELQIKPGLDLLWEQAWNETWFRGGGGAVKPGVESDQKWINR